MLLLIILIIGIPISVLCYSLDCVHTGTSPYGLLSTYLSRLVYAVPCAEKLANQMFSAGLNSRMLFLLPKELLAMKA